MKVTKRFFQTLGITIVLLSIATITSASYVTVEQGLVEPRGTIYGGEFLVTPKGVEGMPDGVVFGSFCLEMTEPLAIGGTYKAVLNTEAVRGSEPVSDPLGAQTAWLYHQYLTGRIIIDTGAKATDFQYAIWKLEDEDKTKQWDKIKWTREARAYYDMAMKHCTWAGIGNVRVLNLYNSNGEHRQDILCEIPEPVTIAVLTLGVLFLRKKR
ncbi:MAG: hypothetical protein K8R02_03215 [Anaerohalosphaeraceae bacterium]|nr:hypothetical protein [Anaerohalosphaeraceae bacterium]